MASKNSQFIIQAGPNTTELMLGFFDQELYGQETGFYLIPKDRMSNDNGASSEFWCYVIITSLKRCGGANDWHVEGEAVINGKKRKIFIVYTSDIQSGTLTIVSEESASLDNKKHRALINIIFMMIAQYQNYNRGNLSDKIFKLFERAKRVSWAADEESFTEAIKDL